MEKILLTIAIPTYNRANYLSKCLDTLIPQITPEIESKVEILVSNNASTDTTQNILNKYSSEKFFKEFTNISNIGADRNINSCYEKAAGKYVWIMGDDDFLLPGFLIDIVHLLENNELGVVHVSHQSFTNEEEIIPVQGRFEVTNNISGVEFVKRFHYYLTFISSHIFNKNIVSSIIKTPPRFDTYLIQLEWYITAIMEVNNNAVVENKILASKRDNSGGYQMITTFSKNYNSIIKSLVKGRGYNRRIIYYTNINLIRTFIPGLLNQKLVQGKLYENENDGKVLLQTFWHYKLYWEKIAPVYVRLYLRRFVPKSFRNIIRRYV